MPTSRSVKNPQLRFAAALVFAFAPCIAACGDDTNNGMDASVLQDAQAAQDAAQGPDSGPSDAGFLDATTPRDGGHFCVVGNNVPVDGENVEVTVVSANAAGETGQPSVTSCINNPVEPAAFGAQIFIRGCLNVLEVSATSSAAIRDLEFALFEAETSGGDPVDPTFSATTGLDRSAQARVETPVNINFGVARTTCPGGVEAILGFQANASGRINSEVPYVLRIRGTNSGVWVPSYWRFTVRNEEIVGAGSSLDTCNGENCFVQRDLYAVRQDYLTQSIATAGRQGTILGWDDYDDGIGDGYGLFLARDCLDGPIENASAGFFPLPAAIGYLNATTFVYETALTQTTRSGLVLGLGFVGTATVGGDPVHAAVALSRDGTCTESFGGLVEQVYPDSVTYFRSGRESVIH